MRWKRKQKNLQQARESYSAVHPDVDLTEMYDRTGHPDHWDDPETEFSDEFDLLHEHQDDDQGIVAGDTAPDPWQQRNESWEAQMAHAGAVEQIQARYERRLAPYQESMKRNPGVKPTAMARLEQARDAEIRELTRSRDKAEALERAARMAPQRAVQAAERQLEQAALNAFGRDLPGGSRRYRAEEFHGRGTRDIAVW